MVDTITKENKRTFTILINNKVIILSFKQVYTKTKYNFLQANKNYILNAEGSRQT